MERKKVKRETFDGAAEDGRRLRSSRSRQQIVRAMYALIRDGDMSPSAARVARVAGVSLRTVFRHFAEMNSLYREIGEIVEAEVRPILARPLDARDWRTRLDELVIRRTEIYERILPYKVAGSLRRFSSRFLMRDYQRFVRLERQGLLEQLPSRIVGNPVLFGALEMVTSFQSWLRMRQDQRLSVREARAVMQFAVKRLLGRG